MFLNLKENAWTLTGWAPLSWRWAISMENQCLTLPDIAAIPATVPGSVQQALRNADLLPDWFEGLNARACEWVENRDWMFSTTVSGAWAGQSVRLRCEGLDGAGEILVNKRFAGRFDNAFVPHVFEIGRLLEPDRDNRLDIVFFTPPRALGQINRTSRIVECKPRFNYNWDWCNRLVQLGVWDRIVLTSGLDGALDGLVCRIAGHGMLQIGGDLPDGLDGKLHFRLREAGGTEVFAFTTTDAAEFRQHGGCTVAYSAARRWNPNGKDGERVIYELSCELTVGTETVERSFTTGFADIVWRHNPGAPAAADPWLCEVNGEPVFLQGINWTPVRPNFADVTDAQTRERLALYAAMGCNLIRVWGGAVLEKEFFYRTCDELGLMVIQEFPLSSSGIDNFPPEDAAAIRNFGAIARSYITRRQSHPCVLAWCGGNELQWGVENPREGVGIPVGLEHPMLAHFAAIAGALDPGRRFLATSPSGPRGFGGDEFGEGLHWDVHGPWHVVGGTRETQHEFWAGDDALMRSETGAPGATSPALLERYAGALKPEPFSADNPFWRRYYWYHSYELFQEQNRRSPRDPAEFVAWSQSLQADALAIAAAACKNRFPACGGLIIWMGHDAYPCPENTSIVNFDGTPKPAVAALTKVFQA